MEPPGVLLFVFFLLFICRSFQYGNSTSIEGISPSSSLIGNSVIVVTLEARQADLAVSTQNSSTTSCSTSKVILASITNSQQLGVPSAGPSGNSSFIDIGTSTHNFSVQAEELTPNNVVGEVTFHVANTSNETFAGPSHSVHLVLSTGDIRNQSNDVSPSGNHTRSQESISDRWLAHLRNSNDRKRKSQHTKDDAALLKLPKSNSAPRAGLAGLAAGAIWLATLDPDKRRKRQKRQEQGEPQSSASQNLFSSGNDDILQPETRPISHEQLVAEVKGIYAGLVMVEAKCIEVDSKQAKLAASGEAPKLNNEQWQALIALHRTLLHEHHDFFLASQHPSASPALRRLASRYAMPARMWRHGIHSFLEVLRQRLPASLDHMVAFIHLAYSMMALLYEKVPAFEDTWIECLGDLGRYRMAIEDEDIQAREVGAERAKHWYSKASDKAPSEGRLYHHLAILARPNALQQLFYYSKSLCVVRPFNPSRELILKLFNIDHSQMRIPSLDRPFIQAHGVLFMNEDLCRFERPYHEFIQSLDSEIGRISRNFMEKGCHIAIANSLAMLGFGSKDNPMAIIDSSLESPSAFEDLLLNTHSFEAARKMAHATLGTILRRFEDPNVLPCVHVCLAFMHCMSNHPRAKPLIEVGFPWESLADYLNSLLNTNDTSHGIIERDTFPHPEGPESRPFPEDFAMRGLLWAEKYFPSEWFCGDIDKYHRTENIDLMTSQREERILWLAVHIAEKFPSCLKYEPASYSPCQGEFNKARFVTWLTPSYSDPSSSSLDTSQPPSDLEASSIIHSLAELDRSTLLSPLDDDPLLSGMHATLSLPVDASEQLPEESRTDFEDQSYVSKTCSGSLESWLSDLVNLDIASDGSEEFQPEGRLHISAVDVAVKAVPHLRAIVSTDLLVLSQTGDSLDSGKSLDNSFSSNMENEVQGPQNPEEEKIRQVQSSPATPNSEEASCTSPTTPFQNDEPLSSKPLVKAPRHTPPFKSPDSAPSNLNSSSQSSSSRSSPKSQSCPHCNKAFARRSDMNKHIKNHTKPITCQVCGSSWATKKDLTRHEHGFHKDIFGAEEFPCPFEECKKVGVKYFRKDNLGKHLSQKHGGTGGRGGDGRYE